MVRATRIGVKIENPDAPNMSLLLGGGPSLTNPSPLLFATSSFLFISEVQVECIGVRSWHLWPTNLCGFTTTTCMWGGCATMVWGGGSVHEGRACVQGARVGSGVYGHCKGNTLGIPEIHWQWRYWHVGLTWTQDLGSVKGLGLGSRKDSTHMHVRTISTCQNSIFVITLWPDLLGIIA